MDWAAHYWDRQQLEGDEQRFLVMGSLLRYQRIVFNTVEGELRKHGLNTTDYLLLITLQLSESGTRQISSLARHLMVHATTATLATDRLEERGLLSRSPHPTDRRAICVTITEAGQSAVRKATISLGEVDFGLVGGTSVDIGNLGVVLSVLRSAAGDSGRGASL
jgi:DNA-binding MarR family transcriptional regulator